MSSILTDIVESEQAVIPVVADHVDILRYPGVELLGGPVRFRALRTGDVATVAKDSGAMKSGPQRGEKCEKRGLVGAIKRGHDGKAAANDSHADLH